MKIKWNGHASFTVTADDGTVVVTDPYDPGAYEGVLTYDPVSDAADGVVISHDHGDHNYARGVPGSPIVLKGSGRVKGINVKGIDAYHDESQGAERGDNVVFNLTVDQMNICFAGDLGHQLSEEQIDRIGSVDILLAPVGGTYTVDDKGAARLAASLKAKVIIPMHFKTPKCLLPIAEADGFLSQMDRVKRLGTSEIEVSINDLPAEPEVWVLDYAC